MAKCILVVDDDPDIVMALAAAFKAWGFEVETASDGIEAKDILKAFCYRRDDSGNPNATYERI